MNRIVRNRLFFALALGAASSPFSPSRLLETTAYADFGAPSNAFNDERFLSPDFSESLNLPSFNDLFAPRSCPNGSCPNGACPSSPVPPPTAAPPSRERSTVPPPTTAPTAAIRSVVRVYNAYEETLSTADPALGPTRRRVVEKGSGAFVADSLGTRYVLTAAHIFRDGRGQIAAQSLDGRVFAASLVLTSEEYDVALLRVDAPVADLPVLTISASWPRPGETVWRAGFGPNETLQELAGDVKGYVKTDRCSTYETLKIDGPARQGDSGGPVYNAAGEIVGVVWGTDGSDAYATYCGRVLKTLCDYSPTFAPNAAQADAGLALPELAPFAVATPSPSLEENAVADDFDANFGADAPPVAPSFDDSPASRAPDATNETPPKQVAPLLATPTKFRDYFNAALAFVVVFAFGYCGFFATKQR